MKKTISGLMIIIGVMLALSLSIYVGRVLETSPASTQAIQKTEENKTVQDFSFTTLDGKTHTIQDFRGKTVILNFWATWCPPCVTEFPLLVDLAQKHEKNVVLIALSSDMTPPSIQKFLDEQVKTIPYDFKTSANVLVAHDTGRTLTRDVFHVTTYPESLIIAPDGTILKHIIGINDWDTPKIQKIFDGL